MRLTGNFLVGKLAFEEICIEVELGDHLVDLLDVSFEALLAILDALVPHHRVESFDVLLSDKDVSTHLQVSAALLPGQDIGLALHEGMLDLFIMLI
jgi:hypothetical protein